jgi:glycopeptide antibiotics resistance protein
MKKPFFLAFLIALFVFLLLSPMFIQLTSYLHPIVLVVVFFCIILLVFLLVLVIQKKVIHLSYALFLTLLALYTVGLSILLFMRPNGPVYHSMNLIPFSTISFYLSGKVNWLIAFYNLAANVGLFIPYGLYLMIKKNKFGYSQIKLVFLPLLFISCIEILQFMSNRGSLDIDDLIMNMLGIFFGYLFYPIFIRIVILNY